MSNSKTLIVNSTSDARRSNPEDLLILPDYPFLHYLRSDILIQFPPKSLAEYHEIEGLDNRKPRLLQIWQPLPDILKQSPIFHDASSFENGQGCSMTKKLETFQAIYGRELPLLCKIPAASSRGPYIGWREFKMYAEAKEAGLSSSTRRGILTDVTTFLPELWHIFHDELDLDGNRHLHLDHKSLHSAFSKAGMGLSISQNTLLNINLDQA